MDKKNSMHEAVFNIFFNISISQYLLLSQALNKITKL